MPDYAPLLPQKRFFVGVIFLVVLSTFASIEPLVARAGIFSMVNDLFVGANQQITEKAGNPQNMALLEAALNTDPTPPSLAQVDDQIVDESAFLASAGPMGTIADVATDTPSSDQISTYVVHDGDTIAAVAKMFGVSVNTILWANDLQKGQKLKEGQVLVILPISGIQHEVKKGETLDSIAKKYKGDKEDIVRFNGLDSEKLTVGDVIIIPDGEISVTPSTKKGSSGKGGSGSWPSVSGYYMRPLAGGRKTQGLHGNNGVDIASSIGTPIFAAADGTVILAKDYGWNGGYGNYIVIKHGNGTQTLYGHLSAVKVSAGDRVTQGQTIGNMGSTGNSTGSHLHFEVRGARNPF